jgi:phosphodiesterase/alkaline phosphatase D-like protein
MRAQPRGSWPELLLLLGDQVYADELSPAVAQRIRLRRGMRPPRGEVADFEEYTWLYQEAWSDPPLRWLFSTLPTAMIFDDHDLHDDWNTSEAWVDQMRRKPWWEERIAGAFMSYWIYQHLGNLSPRELAEDRLLQQIMSSEDGTEALRTFAVRASHQTEGSRWSFSRTLDKSRLVVIDSRAGRVLKDGQRSMLDEQDWQWLERQATGNVDHLLLATSLPLLLTHSLHDLESWNEAVCGGAWGRIPAKIGERIRQRLDLEHWAAFEESFTKLVNIIRAVASGERGSAPATIIVLSGDVHHAYLDEAWYPQAARVKSLVYQAVCSPIRNPLGARERRAVRASMSRPATVAARALAGAAGVSQPQIRWQFVAGPAFKNQIANVTIHARSAELTIEGTSGNWRDPSLEATLRRRLA